MIGRMYDYAEWMIGGVYHFWQYGSFDSNEMEASLENLQKAIVEMGEEVLKCTFKADRIYSPLAYAIKCGDFDSIRELIKLGAEIENWKMVHFYIDCLQEAKIPNIEILQFLIDQIVNIDKREGNGFKNPLNHAIHKMAYYKNVHWDVIEILLERDERIREELENGSTPFKVFKQGQASLNDPNAFLENLSKYLELEKKYYPETKSGLTSDEFKFYASHLCFLNENEKRASESFKSVQLALKILKSKEYFYKLVKEGQFSDCFNATEKEEVLKFL